MLRVCAISGLGVADSDSALGLKIGVLLTLALELISRVDKHKFHRMYFQVACSGGSYLHPTHHSDTHYSDICFILYSDVETDSSRFIFPPGICLSLVLL